MSTFTRCDNCEAVAGPGQHWFRVNITTFTPYGGRGSSPYEIEACSPEGSGSGLHAEACSPRCAGMMLSKHAAALSEWFGDLSEELGMFAIDDTADKAKSQG